MLFFFVSELINFIIFILGEDQEAEKEEEEDEIRIRLKNR